MTPSSSKSSAAASTGQIGSQVESAAVSELKTPASPAPFVDRPLHITRDRIEGMLYGIAIGDAMGFPVETQTPGQIRARYGYLKTFVPNPGNHLAGPTPAGTCTDDTQLSLAVFEALLEAGDPMANIARHHVSAKNESVLGWGGSTRESVERIESGVDWAQSGVSPKPDRGTGNGVVMKLAPLVVFLALENAGREDGVRLVQQFAAMTHVTPVAAVSAIAHAGAICECFASTPKDFSAERFIETVRAFAGEGLARVQAEDEKVARLMTRLDSLVEYAGFDLDDAIAQFGGGSSEVYDSLPFTYLFFLKDPLSLHSLYELVNAGGDTDSNAAMAGAMLGALHGKEIFPEELRRGPAMIARIDAVVERACRKYGIA